MSTSLTLDPGRLSQLLGMAYDAALDPAGWEAFGNAASQSLGASLALVLFFDHGEPGRSFMTGGGDLYADFMPRFQSEWDPEETGGYEDHLWDAVRDAQPGTVRRNLDVLTPEQIRDSRIYRQLGAPWGLDHIMIGVVTNSIGVSAYFTLGRSGKVPGFTSEDRVLVRNALLSHLRRSLDLNRNLEQARGLNAIYAALANRAPYGLVVFDRQGRTLAVNQRAEQFFREPNGLGLRNGSLYCADPNIQARLDWSLGVVTAVAGGATFNPPPPVQVVRPGGRTLEVTFSPLPLPRSETDPLPGACCLAFIHERGTASRNATVSPAISRIFGLTPAEVRLCEALFLGQSLPEAAESLAISRNTAKTHLSRIFDKTGVRSQIALLRLLAFGPGATHSAEESRSPR
jgi:DNA-binding CsgD family transcriptional regulator/PAS domain-containing protein